MIIVIIGVVCIAICIGYFVYTSKMNKNAKKCSCGKEYSYIDGDIVNYYAKKNDETMIGSKKHAIVTVQLKCSKCQKTDQKKVRVIYDPALQEDVEDGIRAFF